MNKKHILKTLNSYQPSVRVRLQNIISSGIHTIKPQYVYFVKIHDEIELLFILTAIY